MSDKVSCPVCGKEVKNVKLHTPYCKGNAETKEKEVKVKTEDKVPGKHTYDGKGNKSGKVSWTHQDCVKEFGIVTYTPYETLPVTWNGVRIMCFAGIPMDMPAIHRDILERRKSKMLSRNRDLRRIGIEDMGVLAGRAPGAEER